MKNFEKKKLLKKTLKFQFWKFRWNVQKWGFWNFDIPAHLGPGRVQTKKNNTSRSVDFRRLFPRISMLKFPLGCRRYPCTRLSARISLLYDIVLYYQKSSTFTEVHVCTSSTLQGSRRMKILRNSSRKSTDLEEYTVIEPKNIFQLQNWRSLAKSHISKKSQFF